MLLAVDFPMQRSGHIFACRPNADQPVTYSIPDTERLLEFGTKRSSQQWAQRGRRVPSDHRAFPISQEASNTVC